MLIIQNFKSFQPNIARWQHFEVRGNSTQINDIPPNKIEFRGLAKLPRNIYIYEFKFFEMTLHIEINMKSQNPKFHKLLVKWSPIAIL